MLTVKIEGMDELKRTLSDMHQRQLPFATAKAITVTAKSGEKRIQSDMSSEFKSASPYVNRSTFSTSATKSHMSATVGLKDMKPAGGTAPAVLLKEHFGGGMRGRKPFEKALQSMGLMPQGWRAIPGAGIRLDAYGNPSRKDIGEMLGALRAGLQVWKGRGKKIQLTGYFVVPVGAQTRLMPGVYKRIGRDVIKPMLVFVRQAGYRKVIDMARSVGEVVERDFQKNFDAAFVEALRTAR